MKVLITGATHGMGKGVARVLASSKNQHHEIIMLCRSKSLGESVKKELTELSGNSSISVVVCDLSSLEDVKHAIDELQHNHTYLDGIFINAGIGYAKDHKITNDGMDAHFQVNYLSQFMLTLNMLNLLENSKQGGRVIFNTPSFGEMVWDDLQLAKKWTYEMAIGQSMVAKRMFVYKLHRLYANNTKTNISFIGFSIGKTVWSNQLNLIPWSMRLIPAVLKLFGFFISIDQCGEIMAPLFEEKREESLKKSGKLISNKKNEFFNMVEKSIYLDPVMQDKLWEISLQLCCDEKTREIGLVLAQQ